MPDNNPLTFTVIAAIVSTCGTLLGLFLKDFLFVTYFDRLKERKDLKRISKKYKDPILLAATELIRRIQEFKIRYHKIGPRYTKEYLFNESEYMEANSNDDPYYIKYRVVSTIYRFCTFLGWLEIYRQDITFLDSHSKKESFRILKIIGKIKEAIADGQLNKEKDWDVWSDVLIFREELRAIGEGMIETVNNQRMPMGYGKFLLLINDYKTNNKPFWLRPAVNFFTNFKTKKDYRLKRFEILFENLKELIECLDNEYYNVQVKEWV